MKARSLRRGWRLRERESLCAAAVLAGLSLLFLSWPALDILVSAQFVDDEGAFVGNRYALVRWVYDIVPWMGRAAAVGGLLVAWSCWDRPGLLGRRWWRRIMMLALGMLLVVGLLVNGALKQGWGRARPVAVEQFGGTAKFVPAWVVSQQCSTNCSFVSGHAATGYLLLMLGALGSPSTRRRWLGVGLVVGLGVGFVRVSQGGHFASDVLIAGALVWVASCFLRWVWLLWMQRSRPSTSERVLLEAS